MKEVTYEDWIKNPIPRTMWVWDSSENNKEQRKVIYIIDKQITYRVIALIESELSTESFMHCAEIEKPRRMTNKEKSNRKPNKENPCAEIEKSRRMTNIELSMWLREKPTRELKYGSGNTYSVFSNHPYPEFESSKEDMEGILIRENCGEWREPLVEVEE